MRGDLMSNQENQQFLEFEQPFKQEESKSSE